MAPLYTRLVLIIFFKTHLFNFQSHLLTSLFLLFISSFDGSLTLKYGFYFQLYYFCIFKLFTLSFIIILLDKLRCTTFCLYCCLFNQVSTHTMFFNRIYALECNCQFCFGFFLSGILALFFNLHSNFVFLFPFVRCHHSPHFLTFSNILFLYCQTGNLANKVCHFLMQTKRVCQLLLLLLLSASLFRWSQN